jgi:monofunctional biosynthetic peptidoglycan transglycosylase
VLTLLLEALLDKNASWRSTSTTWSGARVCLARRRRRALLTARARPGSAPYEAARLAVMLPRPKYFEKLPNSAYVAGRAGTIMARMGDARLP